MENNYFKLIFPQLPEFEVKAIDCWNDPDNMGNPLCSWPIGRK